MNNSDKPIRQYCIALDFDLTITDFHSRGKISLNQNYWASKQNLNSLIYVLEKFKNKNFGIYVVTRNIESDVNKYLNLQGFGSLIDKVYGAINQEHINKGTKAWALYKTEYLCEISQIESILKKNIYFFDDTKSNISCAKSNGFTNSYLIDMDNQKCFNSNILVIKLNELINKLS